MSVSDDRKGHAAAAEDEASEYMAKSFYYSTQPIETGNVEALQLTLKMISADNTLCSHRTTGTGSNLPSPVYHLPFLCKQAKRNILVETAAKAYNIDPKL